MTNKEEALLWAREELAKFWENAPGIRAADRAVHIENARSGASDGDLEEEVSNRLHWQDGYRAGAAASAERIKELEARIERIKEIETRVERIAELEARVKVLERQTKVLMREVGTDRVIPYGSPTDEDRYGWGGQG